MTNSKTIAIIGAGASGLVAAIESARTLKSTGYNFSIVIYEKLQRAGKKILVTGNGRCNLSNENLSLEFYHGNKDCVKTILSEFNYNDTLDFFNSIGILTKTEDSRTYPLSSSANSILDCLRLEAEELGVKFVCDSPVNKIKKCNNYFIINENIKADKVIIATGGKSSSVHGSDGSGYKLLQSFGHNIAYPLPSLVQLTCSDSFCKQLKGVRANASITLKANDSIVKKESGEIQFTDYGLSGIACMQVSRFVSELLYKEKSVKISANIDLAENLNKKQIIDYIYSRISFNPNLNCENLLIGMLPKKLSHVILKASNVKPLGKKISNLNNADIINIASNIKCFKMNVNGTKGFKSSQVTSGGVLSKEFNYKTLESNKIRGLYACGEVLDIDGDCGGYNLQWAWSSGFVAGKSCSEEIKNNVKSK